MKLPNNVIIRDDDLNDYSIESVLEEIGEIISEYLSDKYGYLHNGFTYKMTLKVNDIDWEKEEEND